MITEETIIRTLAGEFKLRYIDGYLQVEDYLFSPSFRSVVHKGRHWCDNTPSQADALIVLLEAHLKCYNSAAQSEVCESIQRVREHRLKLKCRTEDEEDEVMADRPTRLKDLFKNHPAWGKLIMSTRGASAKVYLDFKSK